MATEKWSVVGGPTTVLSTQLDALANNVYSVPGPEYDNSLNLNRFAIAEYFGPGGSAPTVDTVLDLFCIPSLDGTNYPDGTVSIKPAASMYVGSFQLRAVTSDQRIVTERFELPPCKVKFVLFNNATGQALDATLNVVKLFTFNRTVV